MYTLPTEILLEIGSYLVNQRDIFALVLLSRRFYDLFTHPLYLFNARSQGCDGLSWAATHNRVATARIFLDAGIPVDTKFSPTVARRNLLPRTENRHPIRWIAAPSSPSSHSSGFTPLHLATMHGHEPLVDLFLLRGANPRLPLPTQASPLSIALDHRHERIACLLAAHLPDLATHTIDPRHKTTPLHRAAWLSLPLCTRFFVGRGCDVNAQDNQGNTPLHHALALQYSQLGHRSGDGRRCTDSAEQQHRQTVVALVQAGADLERVGYYGYTPRLMAFAWEDEWVVECLLGKEGKGLSAEAWRWADMARAKGLVDADRGGAVAKQGDWAKCVQLARGEAWRWSLKGDRGGPFVSFESCAWGHMLKAGEWVEWVMQRVAEGTHTELEGKVKAARHHDERLGLSTRLSKEGRRLVKELKIQWAGIWRS